MGGAPAHSLSFLSELSASAAPASPRGTPLSGRLRLPRPQRPCGLPGRPRPHSDRRPAHDTSHMRHVCSAAGPLPGVCVPQSRPSAPSLCNERTPLPVPGARRTHSWGAPRGAQAGRMPRTLPPRCPSAAEAKPRGAHRDSCASALKNGVEIPHEALAGELQNFTKTENERNPKGSVDRKHPKEPGKRGERSRFTRFRIF